MTNGNEPQLYKSLSNKKLDELDLMIKSIDRFQKLLLKALVCDYIQLEKTMKLRNPFRNIRHYIQAVNLRDDGTSNVDMITLRVVSNMYDNIC